jgi:hypothetical protein
MPFVVFVFEAVDQLALQQAPSTMMLGLQMDSLLHGMV